MDDYSRKNYVFVLKSKDQTFAKLKKWKLLVEDMIGRKIKILMIDSGMKFYSHEFNEFCKNQGIDRHRTIRMNP